MVCERRRSERTDVVAALEEISQETWRDCIPLVVLTHGRAIAQATFPNVTPEQAARIEDLWLELQRELAHRSSHGRLVHAEKSGHYVHYEEPGLVIQAIFDVVTAARKSRMQVSGSARVGRDAAGEATFRFMCFRRRVDRQPRSWPVCRSPQRPRPRGAARNLAD